MAIRPGRAVTRIAAGGVVMLGMAILSACSGGEPAPSQVAATVAGTEITLPMLEAELASLPDGVSRHDSRVQRETLDRLVTEALFAAAAEREGLDRTPEVDRQLAKARRAVLANAYVATLEPERRPDRDEVRRYFAEHPELFTERRRYRLTVLPVTATPADIARYVSAFRNDDDPGELLSLLRSNGVSAALSTATGTADQMPPALASRLHRMKEGDRLTYRDGDTQTFLWIDEVATAPVPLGVARDHIAAFLRAREHDRRARARAVALRSGDAVTYGEVGRAVLAGAAAGKPASSTAAAVTQGVQRGRDADPGL